MDAEDTVQFKGKETRRSAGAPTWNMPAETTATTAKKAHLTRKRKAIHAHSQPPLNPSDLMQRVLTEDLFLGMLCLERKRAPRTPQRRGARQMY